MALSSYPDLTLPFSSVIFCNSCHNSSVLLICCISIASFWFWLSINELKASFCFIVSWVSLFASIIVSCCLSWYAPIPTAAAPKKATAPAPAIPKPLSIPDNVEIVPDVCVILGISVPINLLKLPIPLLKVPIPVPNFPMIVKAGPIAATSATVLIMFSFSSSDKSLNLSTKSLM